MTGETEMKVWTLTLTHRHGEDVTVHSTRERVDEALHAHVIAWWPHELPDEPMTGNAPSDISDYFEKVQDESANIEEHEITPAAEQVKAAALALDYAGQMAVLHAIEDQQGFVPCVMLSAQDVYDEAREDMEGKFVPIDEEGDEAAAEHLTVEMALDACRSVAEDDWSDTSSEASHRAKRRLMRAARDAARVGATVAA